TGPSNGRSNGQADARANAASGGPPGGAMSRPAFLAARLTSLATCTVVSAMLPVPVFGASPGSDESVIAEIIVTAQKRAMALQDVPFSVAAASEQQIRDSGSTNVVDLARNFAGLTIAD